MFKNIYAMHLHVLKFYNDNRIYFVALLLLICLLFGFYKRAFIVLLSFVVFSLFRYFLEKYPLIKQNERDKLVMDYHWSNDRDLILLSFLITVMRLICFFLVMVKSFDFGINVSIYLILYLFICSFLIKLFCDIHVILCINMATVESKVALIKALLEAGPAVLIAGTFLLNQTSYDEGVSPNILTNRWRYFWGDAMLYNKGDHSLYNDVYKVVIHNPKFKEFALEECWKSDGYFNSVKFHELLNNNETFRKLIFNSISNQVCSKYGIAAGDATTGFTYLPIEELRLIKDVKDPAMEGSVTYQIIEGMKLNIYTVNEKNTVDSSVLSIKEPIPLSDSSEISSTSASSSTSSNLNNAVEDEISSSELNFPLPDLEELKNRFDEILKEKRSSSSRKDS